MVRLLVLSLLLNAVSSHEINRKGSNYTAAVVEYAPAYTSMNDPPSLTMTTNLAEYEKFISQARSQGADIIAFPEYGLTGIYPSGIRSMALDFSQYVPGPKSKVIPCVTYNTTNPHFVMMRRLSCAARDNGIYVVVNLLEREDCPGCAEDNLLIFNTNVAFDRSGTIVARYRKYNTYGEEALNVTAKPDFSYFDTDFGARIGLMTCFDIMFESPAVPLVLENKVTDIVFPTAWIHELPFLTGVQTQAMWSSAMQVNVLAAGYNLPSSGKMGSGLYNGETGVITYMSPWEATSLSLVAKMDSTQVLHPPPHQTTKSPFYLQDNLTNYITQLIELTNEIKVYEICHNSVCCNVEISGELHDTTVFRAIVYNGVRTFAGGFYKDFHIQTCGIIRCKEASDPVKNCALLMNGLAQNVTLNHVKIQANFTDDAIIGSNTLEGSFNILDRNFVKFENIEGALQSSLELIQPIFKNVLTFAMWGRVYPKPPQNDPSEDGHELPVAPFIIGGIIVLSIGILGLGVFSHNKDKNKVSE